MTGTSGRDAAAHEGDRSWGFATRAIHAGGGPDPTTGARAVPVYLSSGFVFENTDDAANLFALQKYGNDLQPHRQPDRRLLRGADGEPRGRHRRRGDEQRPVRRVPHVRGAARAPATTSSPAPASTAARSPSST